MVTTPEGDDFEKTADIVIGVMPPLFIDVEDKYINEGVYIDLREGFTAEDGYLNDISDSVVVTAPANFNTYSPLPGEYTIDLEFTHHIHYDGIDPLIDLNGTVITFDGSVDPAPITDWDSTIAIYTDVTALQANTYSWGSSGMVILVAGDGTVIKTVDRHTYNTEDVSGRSVGSQGTFDTWLAGIVLETDGYVVLIGYILTEFAAGAALVYGDPVSYDLTMVPVFDYDIVTNDSFVVTVDDITAPKVIVLDEEYVVFAGEYPSADEAILANVIAFDLYDSPEDLAIYVSDNGGLVLTSPATYTVVVTAEDLAGNSSVVEFDVTVEAADVIITQAEIDAAIQAGIDAIPALEDATGCFGSIGNSSALFVFGIIATLGGAALYFIRKPQ